MILHLNKENYISFNPETISHIAGTPAELEALNNKFQDLEVIEKLAEENHEQKFAGDSVVGAGKGEEVYLYKKGKRNFLDISSTKDEKLTWYIKDYKKLNKFERKLFTFIWSVPCNTPLKSTGTKSLRTSDRKKVGDVNIRAEHKKMIPFIMEKYHPKSRFSAEQMLLKEDGREQATVSMHQFLRIAMTGAPLAIVKEVCGTIRTIRNVRSGDPKNVDIVFETKSLQKDIVKLKKHLKKHYK